MSHLRCRFFPGEPDWEAIPESPLREAVTGGEPSQATWVRCAWTTDAFHVWLRALDDQAWATLVERDAPLYAEEVVEVFLDPVGDLQSYFEIEVNPLNAVLDLVLRKTRNGYRKDTAWNCAGLITAVQRDENSWTTQLRIPFESLGADLPVLEQPWRANFTRIDRPKNGSRELSAWCPPGRPSFHTPERFGMIEFVR